MAATPKPVRKVLKRRIKKETKISEAPFSSFSLFGMNKTEKSKDLKKYYTYMKCHARSVRERDGKVSYLSRKGNTDN